MAVQIYHEALHSYGPSVQFDSLQTRLWIRACLTSTRMMEGWALPLHVVGAKFLASI